VGSGIGAGLGVGVDSGVGAGMGVDGVSVGTKADGETPGGAVTTGLVDNNSQAASEKARIKIMVNIKNFFMVEQPPFSMSKYLG